MVLTLTQDLHRMRQLMHKSSWAAVWQAQAWQSPIINKLYARHGLKISQTCSACPEQYQVYDTAGKQMAYYRLRHGEFRIDMPDCGDETVYEIGVCGDGAFDSDERLCQLTKALRIVLDRRR